MRSDIGHMHMQLPDFITHEQTGKPLCISIHAPWGGGKTSLMRMIQDKLDPMAVKEFTSYTKENTESGVK